jgi:hypothetical protein
MTSMQHGVGNKLKNKTNNNGMSNKMELMILSLRERSFTKLQKQKIWNRNSNKEPKHKLVKNIKINKDKKSTQNGRKIN